MESIIERATTHYGLTEKQARLVVEYCQRGNLKAAAQAVPYDYRTAKRLLHEHPRFQAALSEYTTALYLQDRVRARNVVLHLLENAESEKVQLDAAKWIDERAAGKSAQRHIHEHQHTLNRDDLRKQIQQLSDELRLGVVIEGEAVVVEEDHDRLPPPLPD